MVVLAALVVTASGASSGAGTLKQLGGTNGCIHSGATPGPCKTGRFLEETAGVTTTKNGRFIYIASPTDSDDAGSVATFARNPKSGKLKQLSGKKGCVSSDKSDGQGGFTCAKGKGLLGARDIALSPDERFAYVASGSDNAIAIFKRNKKSGALTQSSGTKTPPCISDGTAVGCKMITPKLGDARGISFTPNGKNLFVASASASLVLAFKRNPKSGALHLRSGKSGCFSALPTPDCKTTRALIEPNDMVTSPNGKQLYVASSEGSDLGFDDAAGAVVTFKISSKGKLHQAGGKAGCISADVAGCDNGKGLHDANAIAVSRNGKALYVAAQGDALSGPLGAVSAFSRKKDGRLHQLGGKAGCISDNGSDGTSTTPGTTCAKGRALYEPSGVAVGPDNKTVYVANGDPPASVDVFSQGKHGAKIKQLSGKAGCLSTDGSDGTNVSCAKARNIEGALSLTVSPPKPKGKGKNKHCQTLYVTAQDTSTDYPTVGGAIAAFNIKHTGCKG